MDIDSGENMKGRITSISFKRLYEIVRQADKKTLNEKFLVLDQKIIELTKCPVPNQPELVRRLKNFKSTFKNKWIASHYIDARFLKNNETWLDNILDLPSWELLKPGRPKKSFGELSQRSKRRATMHLREHFTYDQLTFAAQMSERAAGNTDVSHLIKDMTLTPTRASKYRKIVSSQKTKAKKLTPSEALAIFVEADMTRHQYEIIRDANKNIYPCYSLIQLAKKACYPLEESITVTESLAEVNLQELVNHTTARLCYYLSDVLEVIGEEEKKNLELIAKWGCDGSQQGQYKQNFQNSTHSDSNIFQSSMVPLRLICNLAPNTVVWQNPVPSSPRYCRPIRIRFVNENKDITIEEINYITEQTKKLKITEIAEHYGLVKVRHTFLPTMVDAKVCNAATDTCSTMRSYICGDTSKSFNDLNRKNTIQNPNALEFGLSILHAKIRFFETLLHLSYKIPLKKWQARTQEEKAIVLARKTEIQKAFREEMGLLVDAPKVGMGNTNDGNTSRRFFADPETSSKITGIDIDLIKRFKIILEVISSGFNIDVKKFAHYAEETAMLYVQLYGWYPMSPTIHKLLRHGATVIQHALLPIGHLSEEAAEARNKHFRLYRQNFSRKFSREACNRDVLNRLLLTSDPFLSSTRSKKYKKYKTFSREAMELMVPEDRSLRSLSTECAAAPALGDDDDDADDDVDDDEEEINPFVYDESSKCN